jgi:hypothetical protein
VVILLTMFLHTVSAESSNAQYTLVHAYGYWVLWPASIPLAIAIVVGLLLRYGLGAATRRAALSNILGTTRHAPG